MCARNKNRRMDEGVYVMDRTEVCDNLYAHPSNSSQGGAPMVRLTNVESSDHAKRTGECDKLYPDKVEFRVPTLPTAVRMGHPAADETIPIPHPYASTMLPLLGEVPL